MFLFNLETAALNELLRTAHGTDWANLASGVLRLERTRSVPSPMPQRGLHAIPCKRFHNQMEAYPGGK
jgi:hypothetical protein